MSLDDVLTAAAQLGFKGKGALVLGRRISIVEVEDGVLERGAGQGELITIADEERSIVEVGDGEVGSTSRPRATSTPVAITRRSSAPMADSEVSMFGIENETENTPRAATQVVSDEQNFNDDAQSAEEDVTNKSSSYSHGGLSGSILEQGNGREEDMSIDQSLMERNRGLHISVATTGQYSRSKTEVTAQGGLRKSNRTLKMSLKGSSLRLALKKSKQIYLLQQQKYLLQNDVQDGSGKQASKICKNCDKEIKGDKHNICAKCKSMFHLSCTTKKGYVTKGWACKICKNDEKKTDENIRMKKQEIMETAGKCMEAAQTSKHQGGVKGQVKWRKMKKVGGGAALVDLEERSVASKGAKLIRRSQSAVVVDRRKASLVRKHQEVGEEVESLSITKQARIAVLAKKKRGDMQNQSGGDASVNLAGKKAWNKQHQILVATEVEVGMGTKDSCHLQPLEEEQQHQKQLLDINAEPVKRGRGRPKGTKNKVSVNKEGLLHIWPGQGEEMAGNNNKQSHNEKRVSFNRTVDLEDGGEKYLSGRPVRSSAMKAANFYFMEEPEERHPCKNCRRTFATVSKLRR